MSIRLYVGNLPKDQLDRQELQDIFAEAGDIISAKIVKQRKTGKCRGFGFVTVKTEEQADLIIEQFNGFMFKESPLKIEKAMPRTKGKKEGEEEDGEPVVEESAPRPTTAAAAAKSKPPSSSRSSSNNNSKSRRSSSPDTGSIQPDPRWAAQLAQLKQMLAAQANS